jgi:hypothetical protein
MTAKKIIELISIFLVGTFVVISKNSLAINSFLFVTCIILIILISSLLNKKKISIENLNSGKLIILFMYVEMIWVNWAQFSSIEIFIIFVNLTLLVIWNFVKLIE